MDVKNIKAITLSKLLVEIVEYRYKVNDTPEVLEIAKYINDLTNAISACEEVEIADDDLNFRQLFTATHPTTVSLDYRILLVKDKTNPYLYEANEHIFNELVPTLSVKTKTGMTRSMIVYNQRGTIFFKDSNDRYISVLEMFKGIKERTPAVNDITNSLLMIQASIDSTDDKIVITDRRVTYLRKLFEHKYFIDQFFK